MVLSAAGNVDHGEIVRHAEAQFAGLNGGVGSRFEPARYVGGTRTSAKPFEQSHLVMAFAGPSYRAQEFYTAQVFSGLFGGGMSSRLFQEVRERRGLCYAIYSSCWALADTGLFGIHAATGPEMMGKLIDVVGEQLVARRRREAGGGRACARQGAAEGRPADGARELFGPRRADGAPAPAVRPADRAARADRAHRRRDARMRCASWPPSSSAECRRRLPSSAPGARARRSPARRRSV